MAVKLSKSAKARIKRMTAKERKELFTAVTLLANAEIVSRGRWVAVLRAVNAASNNPF